MSQQDKFSHIPPGDDIPNEIHAIIEIPKGSRNKYEYDEDLGVFKLDRVLYSPMHYPVDYGLIPQTLSEDGDHLDTLVLGSNSTFPGCLVEARPLGLFKMIDDGDEDFKVLSVQTENPRFEEVNSLEDIRNYKPHLLEEVSHFFETYKDLEDKNVEVKGWRGKQKAFQEIEKSIENYKAEH
ncbi:MAG: inorganic diphosphatase [Candidatus Magasanikbacteria bacterium]